MAMTITGQQVKDIRGKYGLSQKSFAMLLGIGEASIVRYERGATPSRANTNLILAADDPRFMAGCIERNGDSIPARHRERAESYVYAVISLDEKDEEAGEMSKMDEIYGYTLRQEVLTEHCASLIAEIIREQSLDILSGGPGDQYETLCLELSKLKPTIADRTNRDWKKLERIAGYLDCAAGILAARKLAVA